MEKSKKNSNDKRQQEEKDSGSGIMGCLGRIRNRFGNCGTGVAAKREGKFKRGCRGHGKGRLR